MNLLAAVTSCLLLALSGGAFPGLPPLECRDSAGHVLPDARFPQHLTARMKRPELIERVHPDYSKIAGERTGGIIIIEAIIDRQGKVCAARLIGKRTDDAVARAELEAVRQSRFKPASIDGKPVPVYYFLTISIDVQ